MITDAQRRAKNNYREKVRTIRIELYPTEQDIIDKINSVDAYATYIKQLIRQDIEKTGE